MSENILSLIHSQILQRFGITISLSKILQALESQKKDNSRILLVAKNHIKAFIFEAKNLAYSEKLLSTFFEQSKIILSK